MASHIFSLRPIERPRLADPITTRFRLWAARVDAVTLGAATIAVVMLATLLVLRDGPDTPRGCRSRLYRDPASALSSGRDGVRPAGDHVRCSSKPAAWWMTGRTGRTSVSR